MIKKIECYIGVCDNCGQNVAEGQDFLPHYDSEEAALDAAQEDEDFGGSGGKLIGTSLCCSSCWMYDDDDEIVIRQSQAVSV